MLFGGPASAGGEQTKWHGLTGNGGRHVFEVVWVTSVGESHAEEGSTCGQQHKPQATLTFSNKGQWQCKASTEAMSPAKCVLEAKPTHRRSTLAIGRRQCLLENHATLVTSVPLCHVGSSEGLFETYPMRHMSSFPPLCVGAIWYMVSVYPLLDIICVFPSTPFPSEPHHRFFGTRLASARPEPEPRPQELLLRLALLPKGQGEEQIWACRLFEPRCPLFWWFRKIERRGAPLRHFSFFGVH